MEQKKTGRAPLAWIAFVVALGVALGVAAAIAAFLCLETAWRGRSDANGGLAPAARAWIDERGELRVLAIDGYEGAAAELTRWMAAELGFRLVIRYASAEEAARDLAAGQADAIVGPAPEGGDPLRGLVEPALETEADRLAYPVGEAMPRSLLDSGIERARRSGTLAAIYDKRGDPLPALADRYGAGRDENLLALGVAALGSALALGLWLKGRPRPSRHLSDALESLAAENARLEAENARLRLELEERSRLEEAKRRIDAAAAARRVEELTRCVIAKALDETAEASRGGESA